MSHNDEIKPLLIEIREIVVRQEMVNKTDSEFRKRVLFVLLFALAVAIAAMVYAMLLVHSTIKDLRQMQQNEQPQKVAGLRKAGRFEPTSNY